MLLLVSSLDSLDLLEVGDRAGVLVAFAKEVAPVVEVLNLPLIGSTYLAH